MCIRDSLDSVILRIHIKKVKCPNLEGKTLYVRAKIHTPPLHSPGIRRDYAGEYGVSSLLRERHLDRLREGQARLHARHRDRRDVVAARQIRGIEVCRVHARIHAAVDQCRNRTAVQITHRECHLRGFRSGVADRRRRIERIRIVLILSLIHI